MSEPSQPSTRSDDAGSRALPLAALLLTGIAVLVVLDLVSDYGEGGSRIHLALELLVLVLATSGAARGWRQLLRARADLRRLRADLEDTRARATRWRSENETLMRGLGAAIDAQFRDWALTPAEAQVGLLLLKGLSLREIAAVRETSERTVREQARALYRKADLPGRAALSAFFLEDLLLPNDEPVPA